ncbi:MAG TPA: undecaprenyldiphospho-muramoylpentapeptide beta-N-acetylglucosaminyltransferase [Pantanalinema sp.]
MKTGKVVLFAGGGTGGHLYPALALADELKRMAPGAKVAFMGTPHRIEATLVPQAGHLFYPVEVRGMPRRLGPELITFARALAGSLVEARRVLRELRPDVVVGTGGYVSAPAIIAAALEGVPAMICEQNVFPGIANRLLSRLVREVATTFPESDAYFPGKARCLGNPIRSEVYSLSKEEARERLGFVSTPHLLVVTGGSLGARSINRALTGALPDLLRHEDWSILHVSGSTDHAEVAEATRGLGDRYRLVPYMEALPVALAASDLVLSRAGATTVAELTAAGKPMVLVPFQHGGKDQPANARALMEAGAALALDDGDLSGLGGTLSGLMDDPECRARMGQASRRFGRPEAARAIAERILALSASSRFPPGVVS